MIDLGTFLKDHWDWARQAHGDGSRLERNNQRIRQLLDESEQATRSADPLIWAEIATLALDNCMREGSSPFAAAQALITHQKLSASTRWPPIAALRSGQMPPMPPSPAKPIEEMKDDHHEAS